MESVPYSPEAVGHRLKVIRRAFGLTQAQVADIIGCTVANVSNMESGRQRPTILQAMRLGEVFGLTLDYIFLGRPTLLPLETIRRLEAAEDALAEEPQRRGRPRRR